MRSTVVSFVVFILPIALGLFYTKHVVANLEEDMSSLQRSITSDKEEIHVLTAEWAYLSRPERVKDLAAKYLELEPTKSTQIADISQIPFMNDGAVVVQSSYIGE